MNYYISDPHFDHKNILSLTNRPFEDVHQMNEALITNWNQKVKDNDDIYIIGDLFVHSDDPEKILVRLNGIKHLILGNHDAKWLSEDLKKHFKTIEHSLEIVDQNHTLFLCHYPMLSYPKQSRAYMIHGHIHNDTLFDYWCVLVQRERILNAGVDINYFTPVTFNELLQNNIRYKQKVLTSYPLNILSVRFHLEALKQTGCTRQKAYQKVTDALRELNLTPWREGLYLIHDLCNTQTKLSALQQKIQSDETLFSLIKNFDVVHVDEKGCYSYLSCLSPENIAKK